MSNREFIFYRGHGDEIRGIGTEAQASQYLNRLNAGKTERVYVLRRQPGILDLAAELATIANRKD